MAGEFDSLRVRIESNSDKASKSISYLITALSDLRKVTGLTNDNLRETNSLLNEMRGHFQSFKSMGDPFSGFNRGADRAAKNARNIRNAFNGSTSETRSSANAMTVWGNTASTAIERVNSSLDRVRSGMKAIESESRKRKLGIADNQKLLEGEVPIDTTWQERDPGFDVNDKWRDAWKDILSFKGGTSDFQKRQAEIENAFAYFRDLRNRPTMDIGKIAETASGSANGAAKIKETANQVNRLKKTFETASKAAKKLGDAIKKVASHSRLIQTIMHPFKSVGNAIDKATSGARRFFSSIKRIAVYRLIRSALRALTQAFSEGIGNLYQWSVAVNTSFAPAMDSIATDLLYVKNALGAMISPLLEAFAPIMRSIADSLVSAFNWVQRVLSQLMGRDHWYKAIRVQTQYQEATNDTTKAVKKLRDEIHLMDWDELNNITENNDDGTGSGNTAVVTPQPSEMFVQVEQPLEQLEGENFWQRLGSLIHKGWANLKSWWDGVDWAKLGKTIGEKITNAWNTFSGWWTTHKGEIGEGILKVVGDIYSFFKGLFEGIEWMKIATDLGTFLGDVWKGFREWFAENKEEIWKGIKSVLEGIWEFLKTTADAFMKVIDPRYEEKKTAKSSYEIIKEIETKYGGNFGTYEGSTTNEAYKQSLKDIESINGTMTELVRNRDDLTKQLSSYFADEYGVVDTEKQAEYEKWYSSPGERNMHYLTDNDFKAYVQLRNALQSVNTYYDILIKKRSKVAATAQILSKIKFPDFSGYDNEIYEALRKQEGVLLKGYGDTAKNCLREYLTAVDWGNGGTITTDGIKKALIKAGLDKEYAAEASRDIYGYLTGTYNNTGWTELGTDTLDYIANALHNNADLIPKEYMGVASEALKSYISGVDWANGGKVSADGIASAFAGAGIPTDVATVASLAVFQWLQTFAPSNLGLNTGTKLMNGTKDGIRRYKPEELSNAMNEKLGKVQTKLTPLEVKLNANTKSLAPQISAYRPPTITIPATIKMQNIHTNSGLKSWADVKNGTNLSALFRANGGYVPQGSLFVAGEVPGQAEMIGNINGKTGVVSGREISGIGDAVYSTGNTTANLLEELIRVVASKNLVISPSAALGKTIAKSERLYAMQTG